MSFQQKNNMMSKIDGTIANYVQEVSRDVIESFLQSATIRVTDDQSLSPQ